MIKQGVKYKDIANDIAANMSDIDNEIINELWTHILYAGYIKRQDKEKVYFNNLSKVKLPHNINYQAINGLSNEVKERLTQYKPETLAQAFNLSGVTASAISLLLIHAKKGFPIIINC